MTTLIFLKRHLLALKCLSSKMFIGHSMLLLQLGPLPGEHGKTGSLILGKLLSWLCSSNNSSRCDRNQQTTIKSMFHFSSFLFYNNSALIEEIDRQNPIKRLGQFCHYYICTLLYIKKIAINKK